MRLPSALSALLLSALLLSACGVPKDDIADDGYSDGDTYYPDLDTPGPDYDASAAFKATETMNEDGTWDITIDWNDEEMGTIEKDKTGDGYNAVLIEVNGENAYIGVNISGLGGYILYGGAHSVYRLNLETKEITELWLTSESMIAYATDVSPDENNLAVFYSNEIGELFLEVVTLRDINGSQTDIQYIISDEFDEAGEGQFSPDGTKLAYAASIKGDWEEVTALFVLDLDTGKVEEVTREKGTGQVLWLDDDIVVLD